MVLPKHFYQRPNVVKIAKELLGKIVVTHVSGRLTSGIIVETEAYSYVEKGCHAYRGKTNRNSAIFNNGGCAYVYLCYGIHSMFNVVTNKEGKADAVLIRAVQPLVGAEFMLERTRAKQLARITSGPGKLCNALGIDRKLNNYPLNGNDVWIESDGANIPARNILASPRIGIGYAGEDALLPWRFTIKGNVWVSKP
jgi:DNA-3-methyladenine glycosylase